MDNLLNNLRNKGNREGYEKSNDRSITKKDRVRNEEWRLDLIKSKKWRWAGHLVRSHDNRACKITNWTPRKWTRKRGRQKQKMERWTKYILGNCLATDSAGQSEWRICEEAFFLQWSEIDFNRRWVFMKYGNKYQFEWMKRWDLKLKTSFKFFKLNSTGSTCMILEHWDRRHPSQLRSVNYWGLRQFRHPAKLKLVGFGRLGLFSTWCPGSVHCIQSGWCQWNWVIS